MGVQRLATTFRGSLEDVLAGAWHGVGKHALDGRCLTVILRILTFYGVIHACGTILPVRIPELELNRHLDRPTFGP